MKVNINNNEIDLKHTFMAHIIYEGITDGKPFQPKGLTDMITFFYATVMACGTDLTLTFEEFVRNWLDENPQSFIEFNEWMAEGIKRNESLSPIDKEGKETTKGKPKAKKKK